ncbi:MAG: hypothetical protein Q8R28_10075, partial [Dehalococcoidia bacterium]|nr:hypothetical protein [Dehalococcoidia bacterium]
MATDPLAAALAAYNSPQDPLQAALAAYNQPSSVPDYRTIQPEIDDDYSTLGAIGSAFTKTGADVAAIPQLFGSRLVSGAAGVGEALAGFSGEEGIESSLSAFQERMERDRQERLGEGTRGTLHPVELGANLLNIPMIAFTGGWGLAAMGTQAAGSEYHEAVKGGAGKGQAAVSGAISGVAELAFSKLVGDAKVAKAIKELTQGTAKSTPEAQKFLAGTGNREGIDELLTTVSQRLGQGLTYKDTFIGQEDIKPILESYAAGFAIGGVAPAPKLARLARAGFKAQTPGGVEAGVEAEPVTGPGIAPDDALSQVRELQNQAMGAKLAQEQQTFDAIMRPLSQDDADAMREYEILEQEEGRLKGQIGSVQEQESDAAKLYDELEEKGKWGLSKDTVNSILR